MSVAADMLAILSSGPRSAPYVFGAETGRGSFLQDEREMPDTFGGSVVVQQWVLRVPVAKLTTVARDQSITINATSYTVADVQVRAAGEIREVWVK